MLKECGDEELQQVYELRQRTKKSEKWERERCRELSALLRLKLDERGVLGVSAGGGGGGSGEDGDYSSDHHLSLSSSSDLPFSSSPSSSDPQQLTVYHPHPQPSSSSSTSPLVFSPPQNSTTVSPPSSNPRRSSSLPTTFEYPHMQPQGQKHKIRSMSQLVASMLFHRQSDTLRRHPSRKATTAPGGSSSSSSNNNLDCTTNTTIATSPSYSSGSLGESSTGGGGGGGAGGMKVVSKRRSRLSKVYLAEELELDSEEEKGTGDDVRDGEDGLGFGDGSLDSSRSNLDLDEEEVVESSSRTVPELCESPK